MTAELPFLRATIIGGNGAVGRLLGAALASSDNPELALIDCREGSSAIRGTICITADARQPSAQMREVIAASDLVILATSEDVALDSLPSLLPLLRSEALLVDTLSVKSRIAALLASETVNCELLGINPMFAPDLGFSGRSVIVVPYAAKGRARHFQKLLSTWRATTVSMSAEEHDRACAALQVATHAAILGFAFALKASGYDPATVAAIMPPPHRTLLALTGRILAADPAVYHDIQASNPFAAEMRARLREAQATLEASVAAGPAQFARDMSGLREMLAHGDVDYAELCARLFEVR
jgi:4-amino-4-deoxyprephenate dehydrogenase